MTYVCVHGCCFAAAGMAGTSECGIAGCGTSPKRENCDVSWMAAPSRRHLAGYFWSGARRFWRSFRLSRRSSVKTSDTPRDTNGRVTDDHRTLLAHTPTQIGHESDADGTLTDAHRTLIVH